ncbi:hypothetical protein PAXINDRAFT_165875 [Paxillus involutus ATCC 200175]|nr:hypothetical protein PAXINDRAFT_165875 [Paxillus involutus ATCC 200175]
MQSRPPEDQPRPVETFTVDDGATSLGFIEQGPVQMWPPYYCVPRSLTISIAGTLGTGLFLGSGVAITSAGPLGALFAYMLVSTVAYASLCAISEMTCFAPTSGTFPHHASRWVDEALGFAVGWNYVYTNMMTIPVEIYAAQLLTSYWDSNPDHQWIYVGFFCLLCFIINVVGWRWSEQAQFMFSVMKLAVLAALVLISLVIILGGAPNHDRIGFRYWKKPGPFATPGILQTDLNMDRLLGFTLATMQAAFSFQGMEIAAIAAVVTESPRTPRRNIARVIRKSFYYILSCYIVGILIAGMIVSSNDPLLLSPTDGPVGQSPFIIAMNNAGITGVLGVVNVCLIASAISAGNAFSFAASRVLVTLAESSYAPIIFKKTYKETPIVAVLFTSAFSLLAFAYLDPYQNIWTVFQSLLSLSTVGGFMSWATINLTYLYFYQGLKFHNIDRKKFIYQGTFQPWLSIWGLYMSILFVVVNGLQILNHENQGVFALVTYINIPAFLFLYGCWKIIKKTSFRRVRDRDYNTGIPSIDETETEPRKPRGFLEKVANVVF